MGYRINEYDWCVMKKNVKGRKCTILCHVDDLKMSHINSNAVTSVLADIDAEYAKIEKMIITRGKIHTYLGVNIDYSSPGKVKFSMVNYIRKMIDGITEYMKGESATLEVNLLFDTAQDMAKLSKTDTYLYHYIVVQILYLS